MPTVKFHGQIFPRGTNVSIFHKPILRWEEQVIDLIMNITCDITDSNITVIMDVNRYERSLIKELRMRAIDVCQASVNLIAFAKGVGLSVLIDKMTEPDGTVVNVRVRNPSLEAACKSFQLDGTFDAVYSIVLQDVHLMLILNDLILALNTTHASPTACGRMLDGLKNHLSPGNIKDPAAWAALRAAINVDSMYLRFITDISKSPRHGKIPNISDKDTNEILTRSWIIMDRYLEFRKRGGIKPLPLSEFPMLTG